jgi:hypothetical protein
MGARLWGLPGLTESSYLRGVSLSTGLANLYKRKLIGNNIIVINVNT